MYHGIINVYKEPGYTSHGVITRLRGILKQKKIGHTGTLDPATEGILPVRLGTGTKLCDILTDRPKTYQAVILLGCEADTQDTTGTILTENEEGALSLTGGQVRDAVMEFRGNYAQIPPMYSALKAGGKKLCELTRAGREVERQPRPMQVPDIKVNRIDLPRVWMETTCSEGTYIRTLCHDIGRLLECGDYMEHPTHTRVGRFSVEDSLIPDQLEQLHGQRELESYVLPMKKVLQPFRPLRCLPEADSLLRNGNPHFARQLDWNRSDEWEAGAEDGQMFRICDSNHRLTGVYQYQRGGHWWKPWKMFPAQHPMQHRRNTWSRGKTRK